MGKPHQYGRNFGFKQSIFGSDTNGHDVKAFGDTTGKYVEWDASADELKIYGTLDKDGTDLAATFAEINRACDASTRVVNVTAATLAVTEAAHDNKIVTINKADGCAVTLPAATGSGIKLHFIIGTTITSNSTTIKVTGNDVMTGVAIIANDTDNSVSGFETAATSDTITFNGSTTGGIKGDSVELIDIAADLWWVRVNGSATGTEATPFSATVT
jgi:hypothetical protein